MLSSLLGIGMLKILLYCIYFFVSSSRFAHGEALTWSPLSSSPVGCSGYSTTLAVPLDYKGGSSGTLTLYVRKYMKSGKTPARSVHLVIGGPGQASDMWLGHFPALFNLFGDDSLFVITDHRGMDKSSPLCAPGDMRWKTDWGSFKGSLPYPIEAITISNAGQDLAKVAGLVAEEYPGVKNIVIGSSYGSRVATAAVNAAPNTFDNVIFDGLDVENSLSSLATANASALIKNCSDNSYCYRMVGNPAALEKSIATLKRDTNECTKIFFTEMIKKFPKVDDCGIFEAAFYQLLLSGVVGTAERRQLPAMYIIALLKQFNQCTDHGLVQDLTLKTMSYLGNIHLSSGMGSLKRAESQFAKPETVLGHYYITASEKWRGTMPSSCAICEGKIYKICVTAAVYGGIRNIFGASAYLPSGPSQQSLTSKKTRVLILASELDYNTPLSTASTMMSRMKVPEVKMLTFRNRAHGLLQDSECIRLAMKGVLGGGYGAAEKCIKAVNSVTLDWEGQDSPDLGRLFSSPPTTEEKKANERVLEGQAGRGGFGMGMIVMVMMVMIILGGAGGYVYVRRGDLFKKRAAAE